MTSSNRTFMELKYNHFNKEGAKYLCSNRTFMELKLRGNKEGM